MKKLILLMVIALCAPVFGQYTNTVEWGPMHSTPLEVEFYAHADSLADSLVVQFYGRSGEAWADTLEGRQTIASTKWEADRVVLWSGYCEIDVVIDNTDLVTDSLQVKVYGLDEDGNVRSNDYVWLDFGTPPAYNTSVKTLDWTDGVLYRASLTSAFGKGTYGFLIVVDVNDETNHYGNMTVKIYL